MVKAFSRIRAVNLLFHRPGASPIPAPPHSRSAAGVRHRASGSDTRDCAAGRFVSVPGRFDSGFPAPIIVPIAPAGVIPMNEALASISPKRLADARTLTLVATLAHVA